MAEWFRSARYGSVVWMCVWVGEHYSCCRALWVVTKTREVLYKWRWLTWCAPSRPWPPWGPHHNPDNGSSHLTFESWKPFPQSHLTPQCSHCNPLNGYSHARCIPRCSLNLFRSNSLSRRQTQSHRTGSGLAKRRCITTSLGNEKSGFTWLLFLQIYSYWARDS